MNFESDESRNFMKYFRALILRGISREYSFKELLMRNGFQGLLRSDFQKNSQKIDFFVIDFREYFWSRGLLSIVIEACEFIPKNWLSTESVWKIWRASESIPNSRQESKSVPKSWRPSESVQKSLWASKFVPTSWRPSDFVPKSWQPSKTLPTNW